MKFCFIELIFMPSVEEEDEIKAPDTNTVTAGEGQGDENEDRNTLIRFPCECRYIYHTKCMIGWMKHQYKRATTTYTLAAYLCPFCSKTIQ
jgi:hypothetical protein